MNKARAVLIMTIALVLAACAPQTRDDGALDNLRADLDAFRAESELAELVPLAVADAERAARAASADGLDEEERAHRIRIAEKRIEIARAEAFRARASAGAEAVEAERTRLLLRASRLEVEQARREAEQARMLSAATSEEIERTRRAAMTADEQRDQAARREQQAREEAEAARRLADAQASEIELAHREAQLASEAAESLRRRLELMELRETDRGVVVTLGDVLFELGQTELQAGAKGNLEDVVDLLQTEPERRIRIEGHTDSSGPATVNMRISQERADAVRDALVGMGIAADRVQAVGMGEEFPIASNENEDGRSQNRRVDVILLND
ncbi:OmpA family protein [Wenzhouxiangella limi]|uniref:OmpA family protein n=1 Tax=Wenzhouxiangella limi TaxID=2707351 RepID=A0A845V342_9GAMM|nr:OmpA family protein [Wenzhouxiangella limi]NDY96690.1 OmpA family protein [Wenzhouxiangella limi]